MANGQPRLATQVRDTEQAYLCLGGPALSRVDPDRYALRLANAVLGDGMSSRLFLEVRERLGLAYDVQSYVNAFFDTGALVVTAGVEPEQMLPALDALLVQVDKLRQTPVSETELRKVKEYVKGAPSWGWRTAPAWPAGTPHRSYSPRSSSPRTRSWSASRRSQPRTS